METYLSEIGPKTCYNVSMKKHWSTDERELKKDPRAYAVWRLEERINHGVGQAKISESDLRTYWNEIEIDAYKRRALSLALV